MELSAPGADLFGANEAAALRALSRQANAVSGRDVARLSGTSPSSARRALLHLERIGLVSAQDSSHARLYSLRRDHVLWEPVQQVLSAPARLRQAITELVTGRVGQRATVALFGSVARGDSTADSDVDIALVLTGDVEAGERDAVVDDLIDLVQAFTGNTAQVFAVDRTGLEAMARADDPLLVSWSQDAVTLAGPDLRRLVRQVSTQVSPAGGATAGPAS